MNYIKHLAGFFDRVAADERLNPTHVSMYVSLFQFWNASRFQNPISISRNELMKVSKISAKATYHKCMRELNDFGYLKYMPSYNPFKGSLVHLFNFQTGSEQPPDTHHTKNGTGSEQAQEPYINSSNIINQTLTNLGKQAQKKDVQKVNRLEEKEKLRQKKKNVIPKNMKHPFPFSEGEGVRRTDEVEESVRFIIPKSIEVQEYFASQKFPAVEAEKFYNYFQSNGWLVGGRTKMKDWKAAARNWMLNAQKFANPPLQNERVGVRSVKPTAKHLHANTNKNYSEPL
jgi:hypothetical protein